MSSSQGALTLDLPWDPLLAAVPAPYTARFYPYGFPAVVASNSPAVLRAADENWAGLPKRFSERPLEIRCLVAGGSTEACPPPPVVRARRNLLVAVADGENFSCCDLCAGFGFAWVTRAAAANIEYLRYHFLQAMAYSLLDTLHMVSLHSACVTLGGHGVLLAGSSGAGKSTLAYACARRGWTYTADDCSSLVRRREGRVVIGDPRLFRFRESVGLFFPEFRGLRTTQRGNGKPSIEVKTAPLAGIRTAAESHVDFVVFLDRRGVRKEPRAGLVSVSKKEALRRLFLDAWPVELPVHEERQAAVERLEGAQFYEMCYRDLDFAVDRLEQLVHGEEK